MFGLSKYAWIALAVSLAANGGLAYLYKEALQDTARVQLQEQLERAIALQESTLAAASAQEAAHAVRVTELQRRLELSDQVSREHADRAAVAVADLHDFEASLGNRRETQPDYAEWADTKLPTSVGAGLRALEAAEDPEVQ